MRRARRSAVAVACLMVVALAPVRAQDAAPSDAVFDALLRQHVRAGLVDYDAFARAPEMAAYLAQLARTDPSRLTRTEQLAFWINAYNAYTIQQINAHHERRSIKNINKTGFLSLGGAWKEPMATVGGRQYTLDEIEHQQIRPVFREPRVHFALVCAARGCPPLRSEAYRAFDLDRQLDEQAREFLLRSPSKNRIDLSSHSAHLSPIFKWYGADFGVDDAAVLRAIARFFPAGPAHDLLAAGRVRILWTDYDWSLNLLTEGMDF